MKQLVVVDKAEWPDGPEERGKVGMAREGGGGEDRVKPDFVPSNFSISLLLTCRERKRSNITRSGPVRSKSTNISVFSHSLFRLYCDRGREVDQ